jgi:hypothetical protein
MKTLNNELLKAYSNILKMMRAPELSDSMYTNLEALSLEILRLARSVSTSQKKIFTDGDGV